MVGEYGLSHRVTYITFSMEATLEFVKCAPEGTEVYHLGGDWTPMQLKAAGCAGLDYNIGVMRNHPEWIEQCHRMGMKVNIWTANTPEDLQWCVDVGADLLQPTSQSCCSRCAPGDGIIYRFEAHIDMQLPLECAKPSTERVK